MIPINLNTLVSFFIYFNFLFNNLSITCNKILVPSIINKIKIPKEINPRSESDMPNKKCKAEQRLAELKDLLNK